MYPEDSFILISALQHYAYCPRQCALIHVEDAWRENVYTVRGGILHEKVDTDTYETRGTLKTIRGLRIHSARLGITGRCDVVELSGGDSGGQTVTPVEYKAGQPKEDDIDKIQLCAQALCLEEMLNTTITQGAFFYGKIRRRDRVEIDKTLRARTEETIAAVHELVDKQRIPTAQYSDKCKHCSLEEICMPKAMNERKLKEYLDELYAP